MNIEKEREAFEQWVSVCGLNVSTADGLYRSHVVGWMWQAWQAALQSSEVHAWKRDAERYRWLKKQFRIMSPNMGGNRTWVLQRPLREGCSIDAVCDASMEQQK